MAVARRTFKKRTTRKRTTTRKPVSLIKRLAPAAIAGVGGFALKMLKNKLGLNTETNFLDTVDTVTTIGTTAAVTSYALTIPQGDTSGSRSGAGCRLTSYEVSLSLITNVAATIPGAVRVIIFGQKDGVNGTVPGTSSILQAANNIGSPYNMNYEGYTVFYDHTFQMTGFGANGQSLFNHHISVPLPIDWHLKWTNADTTGSSANLQAGYIRMALMYDGFTTGQPSYQAYTRVKWVDN